MVAGIVTLIARLVALIAGIVTSGYEMARPPRSDVMARGEKGYVLPLRTPSRMSKRTLVLLLVVVAVAVYVKRR